ncbi:hypothetical protein AGLY_014544, partial [Aphis glycines]
ICGDNKHIQCENIIFLNRFTITYDTYDNIIIYIRHKITYIESNFESSLEKLSVGQLLTAIKYCSEFWNTVVTPRIEVLCAFCDQLRIILKMINRIANLPTAIAFKANNFNFIMKNGMSMERQEFILKRILFLLVFAQRFLLFNRLVNVVALFTVHSATSVDVALRALVSSTSSSMSRDDSGSGVDDCSD